MMKLLSALAMMLFAGFAAASAQEKHENSPEISGFGDIQYIGGEDRFAFGQVEVDLETFLDERIHLEAAIALEEENFTTGTFIVDFHLFGSEGSHFRQAAGIDHSGIIVGQFDVPFGVDWLVYPSVDRKLISEPVAVANTHDFWNDFGVQGYLENGHYNVVTYAVNGFGYTAGDAEVDMNLALGGRVGFSLFPQLEVGASCAGFFDRDYELDMALIGAHLQFSHGRFSAKGEFLIHPQELAGNGDVTHTGFYAQGLRDFGDFYLVSRYGQFRPDQEKNHTRLSAGGGWIIEDGCELPLEQQINSDGKDLTLLQLAVGF